MLKEMIEQSVNPVGWLGYHEGLLVSFLQTQEQVESFLKNTDMAGKVLLVYTHPMRELTDEEILQFQDKVPYTLGSDLIDFARAILKKVREK
jgi:hypothetical protein